MDLISRRVRPGALRAFVVAAVMAALPASLRGGDVKTGIDVVEESDFRLLAGKRVGLITNHSGFDRSGRRTVDVLASAPGVKLTAVFAPEHGIEGTAIGAIPASRDLRSGVPVFSLYGATQRPTAEMLNGIDVLVYDIQDVGARFYTYVATLGLAMEEAAPRGIEVVVLDRPNPVNGLAVEGPVQDEDQKSLIAYFPMPARYGMTIGELARMFNAEKKLGAKLTVVEMRNWRRADWFDQTGLRWVNPSPNLRELYSVVLHGGMNMLYTPDLSVGRGTDNPYNLVGAPWIDDRQLAAYLTARNIPGASFLPLRFTPAGNTHAGKDCGGVFVVVLDRDRLNTGRLGIELLSALRNLYPDRINLDRTLRRVGSRKVVEAIKKGADPRDIERLWQADVEKFKLVRAKYLLYN